MTQRLDNGESVDNYQLECMLHAVLYYHLAIWWLLVGRLEILRTTPRECGWETLIPDCI